MGKVSASGAGSFTTSGVSRTIVKPGTARASLSRNRVLSSKRAIRLLRARQQAIAGPVVLVNNFRGEEYDWKGCRMMEASAEQPGGDKAKKLVLNSQALMSEHNTESFAGKTLEHKDYSLLQGKETTVMLFLSLPSHASGIADLDEEESV